MRILVLGGTLFVGRHVVEAALERGHEVTLFNRGRTAAALFPDVETLHGDRDAGDLDALRGRRWDAAVDTSARVPRWVHDAAGLLAGAVEHYTFVSSGSVYADTSTPGTDEGSPVHSLADESVEEITSAEVYGALKVLCERAAEQQLPGRVLSARAGLIVGPYDPTGRFTYWVHRIARGGEVLAPEPRDQPVQLIHGRDLADWMLDLAERRETGVYNATGPERPLTMEGLLEAIREVAGGDASLTWAGERFLVENGVEAWSELPLWLAPGANPESANFLAVDVRKAIAAGLRFRPLAETIRDTLAGAETTPAAGLDSLRERELLRS
ncbi:MAG: SDR family oxidoreductase [Gaiellaceae bacterium]